MTNKEQIIAKALELLNGSPQGVRYTDLVARICAALPQIPKNTVNGTIWNLEVQLPKQVVKPARGMYVAAQFRQALTVEPESIAVSPVERIREERFYEPFADWLVKELEECTKAIPVGGNIFKDKWGTPDVIGVREPRKSDIIKFSTEIVSAEVKVNTAGLITAFGQACAYRLFSHKSYLVVPAESPEDDLTRLDTLARICGIGLILFDSRDPMLPNFAIRVRAARLEPDMFYVNRCMKLIEDRLFG